MGKSRQRHDKKELATGLKKNISKLYSNARYASLFALRLILVSTCATGTTETRRLNAFVYDVTVDAPSEKKPEKSERLKSDKLHARITDLKRDVWLGSRLGRDPFSAVSEWKPHPSGIVKSHSTQDHVSTFQRLPGVRLQSRRLSSSPASHLQQITALSQEEKKGERSGEKGSKELEPSEDFGQKAEENTSASRPNEKSPVTQGNMLPRTLDPFIELTDPRSFSTINSYPLELGKDGDGDSLGLDGWSVAPRKARQEERKEGWNVYPEDILWTAQRRGLSAWLQSAFADRNMFRVYDTPWSVFCGHGLSQGSASLCGNSCRNASEPPYNCAPCSQIDSN
ncbi:hypothetical protein WN51_05740 [Melipona quadrifasciata]|uniref:Uncharacterized protein n=1 Tax=Melipona quadrifasciata TaxID=166423 RepID=A0A0N0BIK0_9HYME|nr:hypothetical protein WN51_05740 [Melipona quadrifasciata]